MQQFILGIQESERPMGNRYERQITLPEVGQTGQERLINARAAVVGAGGLGSPVLYYLAAAGIGAIRIIDGDTVDISNLNRQIIHTENDLGREKRQSAKEKLLSLNNDIKVDAVQARLDKINAAELLSGFDIVISCVDNNAARYIINAACINSKTPQINGGVEGFCGYIMSVLPGETPCFQCIFPEPGVSGHITANRGVLGAGAGAVGSLMAAEAIKVLLGLPVRPCFYYVDLLSTQIIPVEAQKTDGCPICGQIEI